MRIGIYLDILDYQTVPIVKSIIDSSLNKGDEVVLFTTANISNKKKENFKTIVFSYKKAKSLLPYILLLKALIYLVSNKIDIFIANDPATIIPVLILKKLFGIKSIYLSLEIFIKTDIDGNYYHLYYLIQKNFVKYFDNIIIMDDERKKILIENCCKINENKILLLPNTTITSSQVDNKYLHKRLNINEKIKIILNPGELVERSYLNELIEISEHLDDQYKIVLHSRRKRNSDPVIEQLKRNNNVVFSLDPVDSEELDSLYSSAYIGLALYKISAKGITAKNLYHIGKSSGKLNNFLKCGIPVIMTSFPYFEYLERTYHCGICIKNPDEIGKAINKITKSYNEYSKNAFLCYESEMKFEEYYDRINIEIRRDFDK